MKKILYTVLFVTSVSNAMEPRFTDMQCDGMPEGVRNKFCYERLKNITDGGINAQMERRRASYISTVDQYARYIQTKSEENEMRFSAERDRLQALKNAEIEEHKKISRYFSDTSDNKLVTKEQQKNITQDSLHVVPAITPPITNLDVVESSQRNFNKRRKGNGIIVYRRGKKETMPVGMNDDFGNY